MWEIAKCKMPKSGSESGSAGVIKLKLLCQLYNVLLMWLLKGCIVNKTVVKNIIIGKLNYFAKKHLASGFTPCQLLTLTNNTTGNKLNKPIYSTVFDTEILLFRACNCLE